MSVRVEELRKRGAEVADKAQRVREAVSDLSAALPLVREASRLARELAALRRLTAVRRAEKEKLLEELRRLEGEAVKLKEREQHANEFLSRLERKLGTPKAAEEQGPGGGPSGSPSGSGSRYRHQPV